MDRFRSIKAQYEKALPLPELLHYNDIKAGRNVIELEMVDKAGAFFNLNHRYPFFDYRLLAFCLSLPLSQKTQFGWSRLILRRALKNILPEVIRWRVKKGRLSKNLYQSLWRYEKKYLENLINSPAPSLSNYVNISNLQRIYLKQKQGFYNPIETETMWRVLALDLWLRYTV